MSKKLKEQLNNYLDKWQKDGHKITTYECQYCHKDIKTAQPEKNMVVKNKEIVAKGLEK